MTLKLVNNADAGTADTVGGNDWDNMAAAINLGEGYSYLILKSGSTYYRKNSAGEVASSGSDFKTVTQAAIDAVNTAGGGKVLIGPGTHTVLTAGLSINNKQNITIEGMGKNKTILVSGTSAIGLLQNSGAPTVNNFTLKDLTLDGNNNSGLMNLDALSDHVLIENVKFTRGGAPSSTQVIMAANNLIVRNCDFTAPNTAGDMCAGGGINHLYEGCYFGDSVGSAGITFGSCKGLKIKNCTFNNHYGYAAISLENFGDFTDVLIDGNIFIDAGQGGGSSIGTVGTSGGSGHPFNNITITNNIMMDSGPIVVTDYMNNLIISNNQLIRSSDGISSIQIVAPKYANVHDNTIYDKRVGTSPLTGILIQDSAAGNPEMVTIDNNTFVLVEKTPIYVCDAKHLKITNNKIRNCCGLANNSYSCIQLISANSFNDEGIIAHNSITSSLANKPAIGILLDDTPALTTNFHITDNYIKNINSAAAAIYPNASTGTTIKRNTGFVTENSGTATVASGTTSIAVSHGLHITPNIKDIHVTPTNNLGSAAKFWISGVTSSQFTINVDVNPGATTATFVWTIV